MLEGKIESRKIFISQELWGGIYVVYTYTFSTLLRQLVSFSHCTSSRVRVDKVTLFTGLSQIGHGNTWIVFAFLTVTNSNWLVCLWNWNLYWDADTFYFYSSLRLAYLETRKFTFDTSITT